MDREEAYIEKVSMATFEAQCERSNKLLRWMVLGWAVTVVVLGFVIMTATSYVDDEVTETTTSEISQESADNGSNYYAGGDYYGDADDKGYYDDGEKDAEKGAGGDDVPAAEPGTEKDGDEPAAEAEDADA